MPPDPAAPTIADSRAIAPFSHLHPGATLASRYRIVTHLGKGGMGEVYRADDLTLGVSVALKFLPLSLAADPVRLDRFKAEVRTARQISHPNICRVFDFVEADATIPRPFITMEYVDGEDLASLLRRIGRLPHDKAVQIARQLCFGLAAAHEVGIIHRDLKPANIMLDGRGNARIMDFGIAVPTVPVPRAGESGGASSPMSSPTHHPRAGTPGYMSPEQFAGKELTPRSDLYSLGLVLYELFTGKPAMSDAAIAEMSRAPDPRTGTRTHTVIRPSQFTPDLDPAVERTILHCLELDPAARPSSAVAVAAALPGGDPLAAALAAGQTPSPELVAQSGQTAGLKPILALSILAAYLVLLATIILAHHRISVLPRAGLEFSPEVLTAKARDTIRALGYPETPTSTAHGFTVRRDALEKLAAQPPAAPTTKPVADPPVTFWYRTSPGPLIPLTWWTPSTSLDDPPPLRINGITLVTDPRGHLRQFSRVPPPVPPIVGAATIGAPAPIGAPASTGPAPTPAPTFDPAPLFSAMGLDPAAFKPTESRRTPRVASDTRLAWEGHFPDNPDTLMRIEAATERGQLVSVSTLPATDPSAAPPAPAPSAVSRFRDASSIINGIVQVGLLLIGAFLARRNLRLNRADRRGAFRLAVAVIVAHMLIALFSSPLKLITVAAIFGTPMVRAIYFASVWWLFYLALEPILRRFNPGLIISWSRLLDGRLSDPLVGRDILLGALAGLTLPLSDPIDALIARLAGGPPATPATPSLEPLRGTSFALADLLQSLYGAVAVTLLLTLGYVILRLILRRTLLATIAIFLVLTLVVLASPSFSPLGTYILPPILALTLTIVLTRLGVLALAAALCTGITLVRAPITADLAAWYAPAFLIQVGAILGLTLVAFRASLANQPLFSRLLDT